MGSGRIGVVRTMLACSLLLWTSCAPQESQSTLARDHVVSSSVPAAHAGTPPIRWEHLCLASPSDELLAEAGTQGWELVAITKGPRKAGGTSTAVLMCFKRALVGTGPGGAPGSQP